jgi:hypothetical protein
MLVPDIVFKPPPTARDTTHAPGAAITCPASELKP